MKTDNELDRRVTVEPAKNNGGPRITGTSIQVSEIVGRIGNGESCEDVLRTYKQLELEDIRAAWRFAGARVKLEDGQNSTNAHSTIEIREELVRWIQIRATIFGVLVALVVLLFGNSIIRSITRDTIESELSRLEEARRKALIAAETASETARNANETTNAIAANAKLSSDRVSQESKSLQQELEKLRSKTEDLNKQIESVEKSVPRVIESAAAMAAARIAGITDPHQDENKKVPVYFADPGRNNDAIVSAIIQLATQAGFRVSPDPGERWRSKAPGHIEIVYSCICNVDGEDEKTKEQKVKLYEDAALRLRDIIAKITLKGVPTQGVRGIVVRQEPLDDARDGNFARGITIILPSKPE